MRRAIAGGCAACITSITLYPLQTLKVYNQLNNNKVSNIITDSNITNYYSGIKYNTVGTFFGATLFFETYEFILPFSLILATTLAVMISSLVTVPFSIKRNIQSNKVNKFLIDKLNEKFTIKKVYKTYLIMILENIPQNILKYSIYEYFLNLLNIYLNISLSGAISAAISSIILSLVLTPFDYIKTNLSLNQKFKFSIKMWSGYKIKLLNSILSNSFGHYLLELWGARN
tara:strand:- start:697 stop:1383 length:687 start_codon:yes stop_codon:yes gene_type:complete